MEQLDLNIKWINEKQILSQMIKNGLEFSLLSENMDQCMPFVMCRDYLQDALFGSINQRRITRFGFMYDPKRHEPICIRETRIAIADTSDGNFLSRIGNLRDFLNQLETELEMTPTLVHQCENTYGKYQRGVMILQGDRRWLISPPMISLYSLLIRIGLYHYPGEKWQDTLDAVSSGSRLTAVKSDSEWSKAAVKVLKLFLSEGDDRTVFSENIEENYPSRLKISTVHSTLGIVGFHTKKAKKYMLEWYK